ncbi:MAG: flagellar motor protein MotB [Rhodobacteraceae bacterium PARR1]|nr:MAG: flagellar motor protein MotB [Rhodobacteraceae bacterium PARR1]
MASNVKQLPLKGAAPAVVDDDDDDECPKCPPVGAPAWLATFADIATNLMAFFVLILGFAKFDEPSFEKMAGSMRETFGSSMIAPIMPHPENGQVIELDFNGGAGHTKDPAAESTAPEGETAPPVDDRRGEAKTDAEQQAEAQGQAAAQALLQALTSGEVKIEQGDSSVTLRLPKGEGQPDAKALAEALAKAAGTVPEPAPEADASGGAAPIDAATGTDPATGDTQRAEGEVGQGGEGGSQSGPGRSPGFAKAKLSVALEQEIAEGLVTVERRDGQIHVTIGEGGGFESGSTELTEQARDLMARIADSALSMDAQVTVTGHTDNVAVAEGSPYVDNLGLGAARAATVVRELVDSGRVDPARIDAVSKGEMLPIADNTTEEGRAKNRRIEIEIDYPQVPEQATGHVE